MGIARLFTQTVNLATYLGSGTFAAVYADPVDIPCQVEDTIREVRNADGEQVVSTTRIFAGIDTAPDDPATGGQFAPGSRVTVHGRDPFVLPVTRRDLGPMSRRHVQVSLT